VLCSGAVGSMPNLDAEGFAGFGAAFEFGAEVGFGNDPLGSAGKGASWSSIGS